MRAQNRAVCEAMLSHRFVADVTADRLPRPVFHRYLQDEAAFVGTAIEIFAHALIKAPDVAAERHLITVLDALANEQIPYFEAVLGDLALPVPRAIPDDPAVMRFARTMREIARRGRYLDIIAAMYAAEWLYATWCRRAHDTPSRDRHLARWVALHAEPAFLAQADWLAGELDRHAPTDGDLARLAGIFGTAMRLEIGFHEAAYRAQ